MFECFKHTIYVMLILALISIGASAVSSEFGGSNNGLSLSTSNDYNLREFGSLSDSSVFGYSDGLQLSKDLQFDIGPGGSLDEEYSAMDPTESYGAMTYAHLDSGAGSYTGYASFKNNQVLAYENLVVNEGTNAHFGGRAWSSKGDIAEVWLNTYGEGSTVTANKYSNKMIAKSDSVSATQEIKRGSGSFDVGCSGGLMNGESQLTIDDNSDTLNGLQLNVEDDDSGTIIETTASFKNVQGLTYSGKTTYGKGSGSAQQNIKASSADSLKTGDGSYNDYKNIYIGSDCYVIAGTGLSVSDSASFKGSYTSTSLKLKFKSADYASSRAYSDSDNAFDSFSCVGVNDEEIYEAQSSSDSDVLADFLPSVGSMSSTISFSETKGTTLSEKLSLEGPEIHRRILINNDIGGQEATCDVYGEDLAIKRSLSGSATTTINEDRISFKGSWRAQASRGAGEVASRSIEANNGIEHAYSETSKPGTLTFKEYALVTSDMVDIV